MFLLNTQGNVRESPNDLTFYNLLTVVYTYCASLRHFLTDRATILTVLFHHSYRGFWTQKCLFIFHVNAQFGMLQYLNHELLSRIKCETCHA